MTTTITAHNAIALSDDECTGAGKCHGCLRWCRICGDVAHTCDARLRGERCAEHPVPPEAVTIRYARRAAEDKIATGRRLQRDGAAELADVIDAENARRAYDRQMREQEEREFLIPPTKERE